MCDHLASGPCVAIEVLSRDPSVDVVQTLRKTCGPYDPEVASKLFPETLRSKFGSNRVRNGVHCTDLTEDGVLESE